ncbi:MAG: hypothetical protein K0Q55_3840, partial [Verrucomicrobia bacterium]|nr:hypothetical protein [Verrucomicrobiota bacterium]
MIAGDKLAASRRKFTRNLRLIPLLAFTTTLRNTPPVKVTVTELTDKLLASYAQLGGINHLDGKNMPSKTAI